MKIPQLSFNEKLQNEYEVRRRAWAKYCRDLSQGKIINSEITPEIYREIYLEPEVEIFTEEFYENYEKRSGIKK